MPSIVASWNFISFPAPVTGMETVRSPWEGFLSHTEEHVLEGALVRTLLPAWEASLTGLPRICSCLSEPPLVQSGKSRPTPGETRYKHGNCRKSLAVVWFFLCVSTGFCLMF